MAARSSEMQTFSLEGEVVELFEHQGQRLAKVVFTAPVVLDLPDEEADRLHLGDRVVVHGWMGIEKEAV
jgi:hypothetical protein